MRQLKFRAWSYTDKKMYYRVLAGNTLTDDPCSAIYDESDPDSFQWKNFDKHCGVLMQYTGLTDKHGKEIYEGDIVKYYRMLGVIKFGLYDNGENYSDNTSGNGFYLEISPRHIYDFNDFCANDCELEGNIHQNPELLNATE